MSLFVASGMFRSPSHIGWTRGSQWDELGVSVTGLRRRASAAPLVLPLVNINRPQPLVTVCTATDRAYCGVRSESLNVIQNDGGRRPLPLLHIPTAGFPSCFLLHFPALCHALLQGQTCTGWKTAGQHSGQRLLLHNNKYEGWNFNSGNYLFTTDTK